MTTPTAIHATGITYATVMQRVIAALIDIVFLGITAIVILVFRQSEIDETDLDGIWPAISSIAVNEYFLGVLVYYVIGDALFAGTLGKRLQGLRVTAVGGGDVTIMMSLVRTIVRPIDALFFGVVGIGVIAVTNRNQRVGDLLAKTVVVPKEHELGFQRGHVQHQNLAGDDHNVRSGEHHSHTMFDTDDDIDRSGPFIN